MDAAVRGKLQLVRQLADARADLEGPEEFVRQFGARPADEGGLCVRLQFEHDRITHLEFPFRPMAISLFLEPALGAENLRAQPCRVLAPVPVLGVEDRRRLVVPQSHAAQIGLHAVQGLEWSAVDRRMEGRVVPKLRRRKLAPPAAQRVVDRASEVHLHALVDALALTVGLRVVRGGVEQFGARRGEQLTPKRAGEDPITVGDDGVGEAVELDDVVLEDACHLRGVERVAKRNKVRELCQSIDHHHDRVVPF